MAKDVGRKWYLSIRELYNNKQYGQALTEIYEYMEKYPDNSLGPYLCGMILKKTDNKKEAKKYFERAAYAKGNIALEAKLQYCYLLFEEEKYLECEKILTEVIKCSKYPEPFALSILSIISCQRKQYKKALEYIEKIDKASAEYFLAKANIYIEMGNIKNAKDSLNKIDKNNLRDYDLAKLMNLEKMLENYQEVINLSEKMHDLDPKSEIYFRCEYYRLFACSQLGMYDEIISKADTLINCKYNLVASRSYILLGNAYMSKCDYDNAKMYFEKTTKFSEDDKNEATFLLGLLEFKNNNFEEAEDFFKEYMKITKGKKEKSYTGYLDLLIEMERYEEAQILFDKAKKSNVFEKNLLRNYEIILNKCQNIDFEFDFEYSYRERQIYSYSEEKAIKHIIDHRKEGNPFSENIDVVELFHNTKALLTEDNRCYGELFDIYLIDHENIGKNQNSYIVVTTPRTKNIITMYPGDCTQKQRPKDFQRVKEKYQKEAQNQKEKLYAKFYKK